MTTIVWDGKTLAADGRVTASNRVVQDDRLKIFMAEESVVRGSRVICYAVAGVADIASVLDEWIYDGCPLTEEFKEKEFAVIIITEKSAYIYHDNANDLFEAQTAECLGSGGVYAEAVLPLGFNAVKACKHGASIDLFSGGEGCYVNCRKGVPKLTRFKT